MTHTEIFLLKMLKSAEQRLKDAQSKLPETKEFDQLAQRIANTRGQINYAIGIATMEEKEYNNLIADLLNNKVMEL